ncbi:MAG: PhoH family protein [Crocinitomicaceae bacterium]|nr:PhoH family protein [Crocinitomicaceae bacterium]MBT5402954.1 PhoH family protein [Crocinitomicaceae bacterium]MBT6030067.1 PhoH family protein [Crocinitomicaceae bacterium]MBT6514776.1 PhoH family protein [Crocinitomicaceae bacterium]
MQEKEIQITGVNPIEIFGPKEGNLKLLKKKFRKLKLIARGEMIKVIGSQSEIESFEKKLNLLIAHYHKYNRLSESNVDNLLRDNGADYLNSEGADAVLVYGNSGIKVKARTANQRKLVAASDKHDLTFAIGPAGTGKTYTAVALAVRALKNKEVKRIILTRPAVEAGENLGFLPGDLKEKLDPYMQPLYDALMDMIPPEKLEYYIDSGVIQIAPLAFMRGRTLDNAFVILDEAQNATISQMKMFLTRMGESAKFIITGDVSQIDLPKHQKSGLVKAIGLLNKVEGISFIYLDGNDIIRHKLVKNIIQAFESDKDK